MLLPSRWVRWHRMPLLPPLENAFIYRCSKSVHLLLGISGVVPLLCGLVHLFSSLACGVASSPAFRVSSPFGTS
jgi:hypothetical protein